MTPPKQKLELQTEVSLMFNADSPLSEFRLPELPEPKNAGLGAGFYVYSLNCARSWSYF